MTTTLELDFPGAAQDPNPPEGKARPQWALGSPIRGRVLVRAQAAAAKAELTVRLSWHCSGPQSPVETGRVVAFRGTLLEGVSEHPFELVAPAGPLSHDGKVLRVWWEIVAELESDAEPKGALGLLASALSLRTAPATQPIRLVPGETPMKLSLGSGETPATGTATRLQMRKFLDENPRALPGFFAVWWTVCLGMAALMFFGGAELVFTVLFPGFAALFPVALILKVLLPDWLAERELGEVTVTAPAGVVNPGQALPISVSFTPQRRAELEGATVTLVGSEWYSVATGRNNNTRHVYDAPLAKVEVPLAERQTLEAGDVTQWKAVVTVPTDAATSFTAKHAAIAWSVNVRIRRAHGIDWSDEVPLLVLPKGCSAVSPT